MNSKKLALEIYVLGEDIKKKLQEKPKTLFNGGVFRGNVDKKFPEHIFSKTEWENIENKMKLNKFMKSEAKFTKERLTERFPVPFLKTSVV